MERKVKGDPMFRYIELAVAAAIGAALPTAAGLYFQKEPQVNVEVSAPENQCGLEEQDPCFITVVGAVETSCGNVLQLPCDVRVTNDSIDISGSVDVLNDVTVQSDYSLPLEVKIVN